MLQESEAAGAIVEEDSETEGWGGFEDKPEPEIIDHEDEYMDEDRYTSVKVESVSVTRDGLERPIVEPIVESLDDEGDAKKEDTEKKTERPPKVRKKKFRYESKVERQLGQQKIKAKKRVSAAKRKE